MIMAQFRVREYDCGLLAACDDNLLGSRLAKHAAFYSGQVVDEERLKALLACKTNINLAGEQTIRVAEKLGLPVRRREFNGVPFALILRLNKKDE